MTSGTSTLDAASVLAAARAARAAENSAAVQVLVAAIEWARLHEVSDLDDAATLWAGRGQDTGIPIAGDGAPHHRSNHPSDSHPAPRPAETPPAGAPACPGTDRRPGRLRISALRPRSTGRLLL
jgi:hypothetical protein